MVERKGGQSAGIPLCAKLTNPVANRSITDAEVLRHLFHRLLFNEHRSERFITSLRCVAGLNEKRFVRLIAHGHLLVKCHPFTVATEANMTFQQVIGQERKVAFNHKYKRKMTEAIPGGIS